MGSNIGTMLYEQVANSNSASLILNIFGQLFSLSDIKIYNIGEFECRPTANYAQEFLIQYKLITNQQSIASQKKKCIAIN